MPREIENCISNKYLHLKSVSLSFRPEEGSRKHDLAWVRLGGRDLTALLCGEGLLKFMTSRENFNTPIRIATHIYIDVYGIVSVSNIRHGP